MGFDAGPKCGAGSRTLRVHRRRRPPGGPLLGPGKEGKVLCIWFDTPIESIACAAEWAEAKGLPDADWRRWWRTDGDAGNVRCVQFMGKGNVPLHTL